MRAIGTDRTRGGLAALQSLYSAGRVTADLRRVDAFAATRYEDRSTAVRQLVDFALRELHKRDALEAYRAGRVTLEAALGSITNT